MYARKQQHNIIANSNNNATVTASVDDTIEDDVTLFVGQQRVGDEWDEMSIREWVYVSFAILLSRVVVASSVVVAAVYPCRVLW